MEILATTLLVLALVPLVMVLWNGLLLQRLPVAPAVQKAPATVAQVSVLIPARNESRNIEACVQAVLANGAVVAEVLVLDDHSNDDTAQRVQALAATHPQVRLLHGADLPAGWSGKNFACHQLAAAARAPLLLFLDADVRVSADAIARLVARQQVRPKFQLLSAVPRQLTGSWGEAAVLPIIPLLLQGYLPLAFARWFRWAAFGAAIGQLVLVTAQTYRAVGGHATIKYQLHDGIALARLCRRQGFFTDLVAGADLASVRMYEGLPATWAGLAKNAHEGMAQPVPIVVWSVLLAGGHVLPFLLWPFFVGTPQLAAVGVAMLASMLSRALVSGPRGESWLGVLLHPLGVAITLAVQYWALFWPQRARGLGWKGRVYE